MAKEPAIWVGSFLPGARAPRGTDTRTHAPARPARGLPDCPAVPPAGRDQAAPTPCEPTEPIGQGRAGRALHGWEPRVCACSFQPCVLGRVTTVPPPPNTHIPRLGSVIIREVCLCRAAQPGPGRGCPEGALNATRRLMSSRRLRLSACHPRFFYQLPCTRHTPQTCCSPSPQGPTCSDPAQAPRPPDGPTLCGRLAAQRLLSAPTPCCWTSQ